jgi:hypothetical protein
MTTLYNWDIYCIDEGIHYYRWDPNKPTVCPSNASHNILDPIIIGTISPNTTQLKDDISGTSGFYKCLVYDINIPAVTGAYEYSITSPPYPLRVQTTNICVSNENLEDSVEMQELSNSVGMLTVGATAGATTFTITPVSLSNIYPGFNVNIDDQFVGVCTNKDTTLNTITTSIPLGSDVSPGVHVGIEKVRIEKFRMYLTGKFILGTKFEGGVFVTPSTPIKVIYINNNGVAKKFQFYFEIYY